MAEMDTVSGRPRIGLALSGGGARGLAHIGLLSVFEREGIPVDCIAGASMGGIVAAAYAAGVPAAEMCRKGMQLSHLSELVRLVDLGPFRRGLLEGERIRAYIAGLFPEGLTFADLRIPLALPAVDLVSGRSVSLCEGSVLDAVLATTALPGLFSPVQAGPWQLVDGGVLNNLPVDLVRRMGAEVVIAVDVQLNPAIQPPWQDLPEPPRWPVPLPDFFLDIYRAELIMIARLTEIGLRETPPELLIRPPIPLDITMFLGFPRAAEIISAGEQAAVEALPALRRWIG